MTIFDLLHSAGIKLAKMVKHNEITEAQFHILKKELSNLIEHIQEVLNATEKA